ncbi:nuclear transport factor 2 family protein [Streptomyces ficellus]|uniref:Nuclear transport factor 2 family protein n=1 Tax=Streptomyces ficellus TaxID=1977088 RepID=A0ABT7YZ09_9ACTN|nr:nuclear transport factor 2 family protein [Streptomyces ficellus]MDN3292468.1 nuclear transport factor 2 family protein [Streptomyces ficellus]
MTEQTSAVAAAIEGELRLLDPEVRTTPALFEALLHPRFHEFGASGRRWDRASMIAAITSEDAPGPRPITTSRMRGVQLSDDVVHLTFDTESKGRHVHRSSLWRRTADGTWLLYFHQGTPFTPDA